LQHSGVNQRPNGATRLLLLLLLLLLLQTPWCRTSLGPSA
jgi:hypothetical protein